jgi:DNA-binding transcriptional LysR family regulator
VNDLKASIAEAGRPAGELRVGIAHGLAETVITSPLDHVRRRFPDLQLRVSCHWTRRLLEDVRNGALDCAVALMTEHQSLPPGVAATPVGSERVLVVAAKDLKLPRPRGRLRLRDLAGQSWIVNTTGCGYREALQRACDRAEIVMRTSGEIIGYDLQLSLIVRGAGLGLIPWRRFNHSPHRRRLRILHVDDFALDATAVVVRGPSLGSLAIAVDHLQAQVAGYLTHNKLKV